MTLDEFYSELAERSVYGWGFDGVLIRDRHGNDPLTAVAKARGFAPRNFVAAGAALGLNVPATMLIAKAADSSVDAHGLHVFQPSCPLRSDRRFALVGRWGLVRDRGDACRDRGDACRTDRAAEMDRVTRRF